MGCGVCGGCGVWGVGCVGCGVCGVWCVGCGVCGVWGVCVWGGGVGCVECGVWGVGVSEAFGVESGVWCGVRCLVWGLG